MLSDKFRGSPNEPHGSTDAGMRLGSLGARRGLRHPRISAAPPRVGKAACRAFEADFLSKIKAVRTYVCDGYVISGNKAFIVYRIDADHADWGTMKMSEVAIQEWSNGKVVREKFVY
jgi:hypothetical protein